MNDFAATLGTFGARIIDGAQDAVEASFHATKLAGNAFGEAYSAQHAVNVAAREVRRAARGRRINRPSNTAIHPSSAWSER